MKEFHGGRISKIPMVLCCVPFAVSVASAADGDFHEACNIFEGSYEERRVGCVRDCVITSICRFDDRSVLPIPEPPPPQYVDPDVRNATPPPRFEVKAPAGAPENYPHMAAGWSVAFDTPYQWTKQVASDHGGTKVGMAAHWPRVAKARGELRTRLHHVIDVAPTILEAIGSERRSRFTGRIPSVTVEARLRCRLYPRGPWHPVPRGR